jgi:hypothetical protein
MKFRREIFATWAFASVALLLAQGPVLAQGVDRKERPAEPGYSGTNNGSATTIDDQTLERTARAYIKVHRIAENELNAMNGTRNDILRQSLAEKAEAEKLAAVKAEGLEPRQYNQVLMMVSSDQNLKSRFMSYVASNS